MIGPISVIGQVNSRGWHNYTDGRDVIQQKEHKAWCNLSIMQQMMILLHRGRTILFEPADFVDSEECVDGVLCYLDNRPGQVSRTVQGALASAKLVIDGVNHE